MASVTGTGSKAQSKGKAPSTTAQRKLLTQQLFQNRALFRVQQPIRRIVGQQTLEALRTGGVGARTPIVQKAVEAAGAAGSQTLREAEQGIAAQGLTGTPFGQRIMAQLRQQQRLAVSQIPVSHAQSLISAAGGGGGPSPSFNIGNVGGGGGGGGKGLGGLGSLLGNAIGGAKNRPAPQLPFAGQGIGPGAR